MEATMQSPATPPAGHVEQQISGLRLQITLEALLYGALVLVAATLRFLRLGDNTLDARQAHEALAALRQVDAGVAGDPLTAFYPLMATFNQIIFFFFNPNNFSARFATALVGVLLVLAPLLWRPFIGRVAALSLAALLATSTVTLAASRSMSGVLWTQLMVMVAGWCVYQFIRTRQKEYSILATVCAAAIVLLTEPTGIITLAGVLLGLTLALVTTPKGAVPDSNFSARAVASRLWREWAFLEGILAATLVVLLIGTAFFASPDGLTAIGNVMKQFFKGFESNTAGKPPAYALLVALRYDLGLIFLGLIGLYFALAEGKFIDRFFGGWFMWGLLVSPLYPQATPDMALWVVFPAAGLSALLTARMLRSAEIGYWIVPGWAVPVHALANIVMIVAFVTNGAALAHMLHEEAKPSYIKELKMPGVPSVHPLAREARVGTFDANTRVNTFILRVPNPAESRKYIAARDPATGLPVPIVIQVRRIDDNITPVLTVKTQTGEVLFGPFLYPQNEDRGIVQKIQFSGFGAYYLEVAQDDSQPLQRGQFAVLAFDAEVETQGIVGSLGQGFSLDITRFEVVAKLMRHNSPVAWSAFPVLIFTPLLLLILFFLAGSLWGSRAAWRGLGLGVLGYFMVYSIGLGWQTTTLYADDPRELWQVDAVPVSYETLVETLRQMSLQDNGEPYAIEGVVQGEDDTVLAWALRDFKNISFIRVLSNAVDVPAVIAPLTPEPPALGADYVGQDFALGLAWSYSDLNWMDFFSWLAWRDTRFEPIPDERIVLWIRKDVYGVEQVITP